MHVTVTVLVLVTAKANIWRYWLFCLTRLIESKATKTLAHFHCFRLTAHCSLLACSRPLNQPTANSAFGSVLAFSNNWHDRPHCHYTHRVRLVQARYCKKHWASSLFPFAIVLAGKSGAANHWHNAGFWGLYGHHAGFLYRDWQIYHLPRQSR